jgi:hypothetical protein
MLKTETFSQGSDMWRPQPISLNCPVMDKHDLETTSQQAPPSVTRLETKVRAKARTKADLIADEIHAAVASAATIPETTPKPTNEAMAKAIKLIGLVKPDSLLGEPDVDTSYGEIHLTWIKGTKQVVLMCFSDRDSLIHHYERIKGTSSKHAIEKTNHAKRLAFWLRWLHA